MKDVIIVTTEDGEFVGYSATRNGAKLTKDIFKAEYYVTTIVRDRVVIKLQRNYNHHSKSTGSDKLIVSVGTLEKEVEKLYSNKLKTIEVIAIQTQLGRTIHQTRLAAKYLEKITGYPVKYIHNDREFMSNDDTKYNNY